MTLRMLRAIQSGMLGAAFAPLEQYDGGSLDRFSTRIARSTVELADPVRSEAIPAERYFSLLLPADEAGEQLVLFSSPLELGTQAAAASEVARFALQAGE
jgi:hypothetical protein